MKDLINYPDFEKLEIRVGLVVAASAPEWSEKLIEMKVNFGNEIGDKTIFAGISPWYKDSNLIGRKAIFIVNLVPKKVRNFYSEGMILAGDNPGSGVPGIIFTECEVGSLVR